MQVGIVTPRYPPVVSGGGEISVKLLANHLKASGIQVTVFSFDGGTKTTIDGVPVRRFRKLPHSIPEAANLYAGHLLHRNKSELSACDVIHAYNVTLHPAVGYITSKIDVPSVATLNSYDLLPKASFGVSASPTRRLYELTAMPTTGRILRRAIKRVNRFITLSEASRNVYRENGFDDVPIDVVPNMIDPSFTIPDLDATHDGYRLLYVGSLIKEKGTSYLIRSLSLLSEDITLRIVGSGDQLAYLQSLARDIGVANRVEFMGHLPYSEVRRHYALSDCFVHPGVWPEPFGRTLLEAMQAGLPVVATNTGGPAEIVRHEDLLCKPGNPDDLASAIEAARQRTDVGTSNREFVNDRFAPETVVRELLDIYELAAATR